MNNNNTIYQIRDRETGTPIEDCTSHAEALAIVEQYEADDRTEGNYTPDFYEIVAITLDDDTDNQ